MEEVANFKFIEEINRIIENGLFGIVIEYYR